MDGAKTLVVDVIPDLCLSRCSPSGVCQGLVMLDPKYRSGPSVMDFPLDRPGIITVRPSHDPMTFALLLDSSLESLAAAA